jgi:histidine triad (HIT) family protein
MLKQQQAQAPEAKGPQKPVFRLIADKEIPSVQVDENKSSLAVLDINPISKGHIIIIPKKPIKNIKDLPTPSFSLAKKISKRIEKKLKAQSVEIQTETKFEEVIINIIPIYDKPLNIHSQRSSSSTEELEKIAKLLRPSKKKKVIKIKKKKTTETEILKLPRRIP